ncbi:MAG: CDGSH iron-sulfur domain-containing protein [Chitinophagaceae bacterium]|nr:CDGSH iron-sulfur domain-containing protein [Rubrivivax sp.]
MEWVRGDALSIRFEGGRCIHSRHCVLEAPTVFLANTPGEWIHPDTMAAAALVAVAHNCPSGAIGYRRHDGGPEESAPPVNSLRVRENGPYAVHAELRIAGQDDGFRATLCRCGQSANKPWCDGSHVAAGFQASGEPATGAVDPLAQRDGPLAVIPLKDGPLQVQGSLELCAGTGRTVARTTQTRLCRCGQSRNKPFCDLSHVAAGFQAAGQ